MKGIWNLIFRRHLNVNSLGFYDVGRPLPVQISSKSMNTVNLSGSVMEISDLKKFIVRIYPDRKDDINTSQEETEALERLRNKVTDEYNLSMILRPKDCIYKFKR